MTNDQLRLRLLAALTPFFSGFCLSGAPAFFVEVTDDYAWGTLKVPAGDYVRMQSVQDTLNAALHVLADYLDHAVTRVTFGVHLESA